MTNKHKDFILVVVAIAIVGMFIVSVVTGVAKNERVECLKLQSYSERYSEFFLLDWQAEMCAHAEVEINAPIVKTDK